jgi:hypothetical protein
MEPDMDTEKYTMPEGVTEREWQRVLRAGDALRLILRHMERNDPRDVVLAHITVQTMGVGLNIGLSETGHVDFCDVLVGYVDAAGIWPKEGM